MSALLRSKPTQLALSRSYNDESKAKNYTLITVVERCLNRLLHDCVRKNLGQEILQTTVDLDYNNHTRLIVINCNSRILCSTIRRQIVTSKCIIAA